MEAALTQARVPEYWRVDLEAAELVVRRDPVGDGYRDVRRFGPGEAVAPFAGGPALDTGDLLARPSER